MASFLLPASVIRYVGVELDPGPLAWARQNAPGAGTRCQFLAPTGFQMLGRQPGFDLILLLEVIEHVADPRDLMESLIEVLRPGGYLVVSTPNGALSRHDPRLFQSPYHLTEFDPVEFHELMQGLGRPVAMFEQHRVDRVDPLPQMLARFLGSRGPPPRSHAPHGDANPPGPHPLFRLWESIPQPGGLWRVRPYPTPRSTDQGFSHQIAVVAA